MKLKYISIFVILLLFICAISAVSATTDDNNLIQTDSNDESIQIENINDDSVSIDDENRLSTTNNENVMSASQEDEVLTSDASESSSSSVSPLKKFSNDLNSDEKTVYLTGNIKITKPFIIKKNIVIDGQGHSIDAQHKTKIFDIRGKVTLKNLILKNGKSTLGGAVSCNGNLNVEKCTFINNLATENGGAIYLAKGVLKITDSKFQKNKVESKKSRGHGGAICIYAGSSQISKTTFKYNHCLSKTLKKHKQATKYQFAGGAIYYNVGKNHVLNGCTFIGSKASNHGGALYVFKSKSLKIKKSTFKSNRVMFEDGGVISFNGKKLVIQNSKFYKNKAYEDGGVMDSFSLTKKKIRITITDSIFDSNVAYKGGGAIWLGVKTVYTMKNNKFVKNQASIGGALYSEEGNVKITNTLFQSNKAKKVTSWTVKTKAGGVLKHLGGAIMVQKKTVKITKSTFKKNYAPYGGAIFVDYGKLKITGNTFLSNKAKIGTGILSHKNLIPNQVNKWGSKKLSTSKAMKAGNLVKVA